MKGLALAMFLLAIVPAPAQAFVCKGAWRCTVRPNVNGRDVEVWGTSAVAPLVARCSSGRPVVVQHPLPSDVEIWGTSAVAPLVVRCR
jgi:hypothetical protein